MALKDKLDKIPPDKRRKYIQRLIDKATDRQSNNDFGHQILNHYKARLISERNKQP